MECIQKTKEELSILNKSLAREKTEVTGKERLSRIEELKKKIVLYQNSPDEINKSLKTIVDRIDYERDVESKTVKIKIQFI